MQLKKFRNLYKYVPRKGIIKRFFGSFGFIDEGDGIWFHQTAVSAKDLNFEDSKKTLEILHVLKNQGKIFQVDNEYWIHESSKKSLLQQLLKYFANQDTLSVSDFKSITSTTRKNAIPLLEFCDKNNFTQREGNLRVKGDCLHDQ